MRERKGQSAMEYLSTYGWALLAIIVILAALVALGMFNPPVPEVCLFPPGIFCSGVRLTTTTANNPITVRIRNGMDSTIYICDVNCSATKLSNAVQISACSSPKATIPPGEEKLVTDTNTGSSMCAGGTAYETTGTAFKGYLTIYYYLPGDTGYQRITNGDLSTTIQP